MQHLGHVACLLVRDPDAHGVFDVFWPFFYADTAVAAAL